MTWRGATALIVSSFRRKPESISAVDKGRRLRSGDARRIARTRSSLLIAAVLGALLSDLCAAQPVANVDAGYQKLYQFMQGLQSLEADFEQTLQDGRGQVTEKSSGTLAIKRPNQFRWDYLKPHPQLIVSDGQRLWLYDSDLQQVTVRKLDQSLAGTPAALLSGDEDLRKSFEVERLEDKGGWTWINLSPKRSDTDFKSVRLAVRKDQLGYMELTDKLGQTTLLQFSKFKRNPSLPASRFQFTPPAGVDVIGDAQSAASPPSNSGNAKP